MKLKVKNMKPKGRCHSGSVIFFHGSGDTGPNLVEWVRLLLGRDMEFDHIKVIYPTAPLQPYTPMEGELFNVWFNRQSISYDATENRKSMAQIYESVNDLVEMEVIQGVPVNRIIVGGFSMGGALAMHAGYHLNTNFCGVFACSSFLNYDSVVYESLKNRKKPESRWPELLMFHGDSDTLVPLAWGQQSFELLKHHGVMGRFISLSSTRHELRKQALKEIQDWILAKLPPLEENGCSK